MELLDRDVLFPRLLTKTDNRRCFDCNKANPKWCSWRFGVLICMDCAALHRQMGVHISQVKSCELDQWTQEQLLVYECSGGNKRAKDFFAKNASQSVSGSGGGGSTAAALQEKYTCRAAEQYKKILAKEVQGKLKSATSADGEGWAGPASTSSQSAPAPAAAPEAKPKAVTSLGAARTSSRRPTSARRPAKSGGLGATRKKAGGLGGLGAKKITRKVDDNLFSQAPEEAPEVVAAHPDPVKVPKQAQEPAAVEAANQALRLAPQEDEEEVAAPKVNLRGRDGHISLSKLMASKPAGGGSDGSKPARGIGRGIGMKKKPHTSAAGPSLSSSDAAQKRFSGAKSISSQQFHGTSKDDEAEKQQRLSKFHGATAISSADYYGNSGGSSPRSDMDASELMGKLSMQAKMDMESMKGLASKAKSKLFDFARDMQTRYG